DRPFQVAGNANFPNVELAITRSCDVFFNKCQNVFNSQPNGAGPLKQGDCQAAADNCRKGENSAGPAGDTGGQAGNNGVANDQARAQANGQNNGGNLQTFNESVNGVTAPAVTNVGGDSPFQVEGDDSFRSPAEALSRSCEVFFDECENFLDDQPDDQEESEQGDCQAAADRCRQTSSSATPGAGDKGDGADVQNNEQASEQDQMDEASNIAVDDTDDRQTEAADTVAKNAPAEKGGKGGIAPATGAELLPLPEVSDFCAGSGQTLADGTQIPTGVCSSLPQGQIPSVEKMVSSIITSPENGDVIPAGSSFDVAVTVSNLNTGFFTKADVEYYTQPQSLNEDGVIRGHTHITIQNLGDGQTPPNAKDKAFFKGLNDKADGNGGLSVNVPADTIKEPGQYRICSMASSFSHQPVVMPVAQRGSQDDCIRVTVQ
ncbi:MAG: hypothetical protein BJ554DRAFT_6246, partial [Olpidium bornovanus]